MADLNLEDQGAGNDGIIPQEPSAVIPDPDAAGSGAGSGAATPGADFDPKAFTLKFKGQPIVPKDRQHLINLAQQGYGYSQSMEQLKREREEFERSRGAYKPYEEMDARFQKDPKFKAALMSFVSEYNQRMAAGGGEEAGTGTQIPPELMTKIEQLERFQQESIQRQADDALKSEMAELREKYKHVDFDADTDGEGSLMKKITKHALDNNIPSLKTAYRDYMYDNDTANAQAEALRKAEAEKALRLKQGKVAGGGAIRQPVPGGDKYDPKDSYADVEAKALKRLGG